MKEDQTNERQNKRKKSSSFFTSIVSGVVGAVLTLAIVSNTPILANKLDANTGNEQAQTNENTNYPVISTAKQSQTDSLADVVEKVSKTVVGVVNYQHQMNRFATDSELSEQGTGSGVIFKLDDKFAYIVTNNHVIENAAEIEISLENGDRKEAELIGSDALSDLAVLKVDRKGIDHAIELGSSEQLRVGESVVAIGNPLGLDFAGTVTQGIVSAVDRSVNVSTSAGKWDLNVIQTDAAINPGNSGGALVNSQGQLIGINSLKIASSGVEGIGFAIPIDDALPLIDQMMESGKVVRPYLGVSLAELAQLPAQYIQDLPLSVEGGVMVTMVEQDSPAQKANIQAYDVITAIDGEAINNSGELRKLLYTNYKVNDTIKVELYRGSEKQVVKLKLAE